MAEGDLQRKRKSEQSADENTTKAQKFSLDTETLKNFSTIKSCVHEVALPPVYEAKEDHDKHGTIDEPVYNGEPAKKYPFVLDPFQKTAVACLERRESILVSAHTSAGKTAVAEYAVAMAFRDNQRVIYTSPLKALSNQKYRELSGEFGDVGLMTGDVTISPNAACLVMTTEILRHMLYHGSETLREVAWVVFDEIHYMRDRERGVVWEESIIFLPDTVKMVFLSATITNAKEFAEWVCHLRQQPCHVVYTDYRPTPLQHYAFPQGGNGLYLVVDEAGRFREDNFNKMMLNFDKVKLTDNGPDSKKWGGKVAAERGKGGPGGKKESSDIYKIIKMIMERKMQPVIVFSFSRRECEAYAMSVAKLDFNSDEEKEAVEEVFSNAIALLSEEDQMLPAIEHLLPLLKRGVGVHHSGLLPILKEIIEILFQEGLIKALFATETFAMGLNMPARTVVFTSLRKWDGEQFRWVGSGEYIQMSGRAGRRGKDDRGICIMMLDEQIDLPTCKELVLGKPAPLESSFRLTYYALLNLMSRAEGQINTEYVIARSFHQFQHDKNVPAIEGQIKKLQFELASKNSSSQKDLTEYHRLKLELADLDRSIASKVLQPQHCLHLMAPGRLLRVQQGKEDWGWGVLLRVSKRSSGETSGAGDKGGDGAGGYLLDLLLRCERTTESTGEGPPVKPCSPGKKGEMLVIPTELSLVTSISSLRVGLPQDLRKESARLAVQQSVEVLCEKFGAEKGLPQLDPVKDIGIKDEDFLSLLEKRKSTEEKLKQQHELTNRERAEAKSGGQNEEEQNEEFYRRKAEIAMEIQQLQEKLKDSQLSSFRKELHNRSRVLQRLGHISKDGVVLLKGRAACLVNTADELLTTELLFDSAFGELSPEQIVALASCFLDMEKTSETPNVPKELTDPFQRLKAAARRVAEIQKEEKLSIEPDEFVEKFKPTLMDVMFQWAKGASFSEVCDLTDVFEGSIVRVANRLNEFLGEMLAASKVIGDEALQEKFKKAAEALKRGIMFANSLYLDDK